MNDSVELLELVYSYLKKKNNSETFENIWNYIVSKSDMTVHDASKENVIAELYADLVLDNRFILTSDGAWGLREFLKYDDIKKRQYHYTDQFETTDEFEDIDLNEENEKNEKEYDDEKEEILIDTFDFDYKLDDYNEEDDFVKIKVNDNLIDSYCFIYDND